MYVHHATFQNPKKKKRTKGRREGLGMGRFDHTTTTNVVFEKEKINIG